MRAASFVLAVLLFAHAPSPASAGFSFSSFFGKKAVQEDKNSQTVQLPMANPAFEAPLGGGDIAIVEESALLPDAGPLGTAIDVEEGGSDQISIYVVRKGDTLSSIAKMFGVSVNTIIWANDMKSTTLTEGTTLTILPISGIRHTIRQGDTISGITKKYKADLDEVLRYNGISVETKLVVGETVIIPDAEGETIITRSSSPRLTARLRGAGGPSYDGYYIRPLAFGYISQGLHGYNGIDIAAAPGTPVFASAGGTVIIARQGGWNGGYGNYVVIQHDNGTQTLYSHLRAVSALAGAVVPQGEIIGSVGSTGRSTGPHLHFEVRGARNPFAR